MKRLLVAVVASLWVGSVMAAESFNYEALSSKDIKSDAPVLAMAIVEADKNRADKGHYPLILVENGKRTPLLSDPKTQALYYADKDGKSKWVNDLKKVFYVKDSKLVKASFKTFKTEGEAKSHMASLSGDAPKSAEVCWWGRRYYGGCYGGGYYGGGYGVVAYGGYGGGYVGVYRGYGGGCYAGYGGYGCYGGGCYAGYGGYYGGYGGWGGYGGYYGCGYYIG